MNWKTKEARSAAPLTPKLKFSGGGKISVSVASIVSSPKVQRQVSCVKEIAAGQAFSKRK